MKRDNEFAEESHSLSSSLSVGFVGPTMQLLVQLVQEMAILLAAGNQENC